jgi:D-glycero-alpha-D-manno-heptose-7-phosphate kinase
MKTLGTKKKPLGIFHARAPLRINDIGGWTDTWFTGEGKVLNMAVNPAVEVQVKTYKNEKNRADRVLVHADNYGEKFRMIPESPASVPHPLLQFAISSLTIPTDLELEIHINAQVPAGISTGTSASVCVALLGVLDLLTHRGSNVEEIASLAHRVETEKLKQQSGIQDQICAAHGGICFIHIHNYPHSDVEKLKLEKKVWEDLDRRVCLVYLGKPHRSSSVHEKVIALLEAGAPGFEQLDKMKNLAIRARSFLIRGDLEAYGQAMVLNNECQRALYKKLISAEADRISAIARKYRAQGWKVNGAGGQGGSVTVLASADDGLRRRMLGEVNSLGGGIRTIPVSLSSEGLTAWEI